jgi:hypothetical protein
LRVNNTKQELKTNLSQQVLPPPAMFFCAISGEPPQEPVVSTKSKKVYERRLILKYIKENGTDPTTGDKLEESDLISIEASRSTFCMLPSMYPN